MAGSLKMMSIIPFISRRLCRKTPIHKWRDKGKRKKSRIRGRIDGQRSKRNRIYN